MKDKKRRNALDDPQLSKPYIDIDEWRDGKQVRYHYVHGGFEGTDARFSFFYPEKEDYKGRFFHFMAPVQGHEDAAIHRQNGVEDKIAFAITHGAYYVETNMGVLKPFVPVKDNTIIERVSAASAEYSRVIAKELFGEHRPYGYLYGGSGGGFKTMICFENNDAWDGAIPYVIGTPMSIPSAFTVRAHARRLLRNKMDKIADNADVGSGVDLYDGLNEEERKALEEFTRFGFPVGFWPVHELLDDGSLPVLAPNLDRMDPGYYKDFWTKPGYLGADPDGSAVRDRIKYETEITNVHIPQFKDKENEDATKSGVDEAWQAEKVYEQFEGRPWLVLGKVPEGNDVYIHNTTITVLDGDAKGLRIPADKITGNMISIGPGFGIKDLPGKLSKIKPGDKVKLDNSDYIAIQTYHRHIVPDEGYEVWDQFRDENGEPIYPQRKIKLSQGLAKSGCSRNQSGKFDGKMIVVASLLDEGAFPWMADWYRRLVIKNNNGDDTGLFRLWYTNRAIHGDIQEMPKSLHLVSYLGTLHQALLDVSDWVEKGIRPASSTEYEVVDGQVLTVQDASKRKGLQPSVDLTVDGVKCARVKTGQNVNFSADVKQPEGTGKLVSYAWCFGEDKYFESSKVFDRPEEKAIVKAEHAYAVPGTYFAVLKVTGSREGTAEDIFTQISDLDRVRIIVE